MKSNIRRIGFIGLISLAAVAFVGCASTKPPTALEQRFFNIQTNITPQVVLQTNVVPVFQTNVVVQTVTVTNQVGVVVPVPVTNFTTVITMQTNIVQATNMVAGYTLAPNATAQTTAGIAGTLSNLGMPGTGSLVTMGLLGLAAAWAGIRNRQYAGQNSALQQVSGTLAQNISTFMAVLQQTPQGKQLAPLLQNYLNSHQAEAGVIQQVAGLASQVDPLQAQGAAQQILAALGQLQQPAAVATATKI